MAALRAAGVVATVIDAAAKTWGVFAILVAKAFALGWSASMTSLTKSQAETLPRWRPATAWM